jgi:glycosyltransferase involved in cell wall biosynthesis
MSFNDNLKVAVIIPCYNEATAIGAVVRDFKKELPNAKIHVFDNSSSDNTIGVAKRAGASVRSVKLRGKGNVVRRMFADVDADVYVMVDGDSTYDASCAAAMIKKMTDECLDMVVGCRVEDSTENANYRPGHRIGNKLLTGSVKTIFGGEFTDMLSGYRVFSRRFAKTFPAESRGFEIETELTVYTLDMRLPYGEVMTPYSERPIGSESKLSTYKDGWRILRMIARLYSTERPKEFWGIVGTVLLLISIILFVPVLLDYLRLHEVPRFPTLIASMAIAISGFLSITIGLVLRTVTRGRKEAKHLAYLQIAAAKSE